MFYFVNKALMKMMQTNGIDSLSYRLSTELFED